MLQLYIGYVVTCVGGTLMGWSSPMLPKFGNITTNPFNEALTSEEEMWICSLLPFGGSIGSLVFPYFADKFGRKRTLLYSLLSIVLSYVIMTFGKFVEIFYVARLVSGLAYGGASTIMPAYMAEILHKSRRGNIGLFFAASIGCGILFSLCLGPFVNVMVFNLVLAILSLTMLLLFSIFGLEVPHYYVIKQDYEQAKLVLQSALPSSADIEEELNEIKLKYIKENSGTLLDLLKTKGMKRAVLLAVCLITFEQCSGITVILYYGQTILEQSTPTIPSQYCSIILGFVNLFTNFIAPAIGDRLSRKSILTFSGIGMTISDIFLGTYFYLKNHNYFYMNNLTFLPTILMVLFIFSFGSGYGALVWPIIGELFPLRLKVVTLSLLSCFYWLLIFIVTKYFASMVNLFGLAIYFWFYTGCCVMATIFAKFFMIETRGKSLKEIQTILNSE